MVSNLITKLTEYAWVIYLPLLLFLGSYVNYMVFRNKNTWDLTPPAPLSLKRIQSSLSISLGSKVGTGAIIGVLAAMWQNSDGGTSSGLGIIFWIFIAMFVLVPITYSEVFLTQLCKLTPRDFINKNLNMKAGTIYGLGLIILYCFGFVGFQLTGIQTVVRFVSHEYFGFEFSASTALLYIIIPILTVTAIIVLLRSYQFFVNILSFTIFFIILLYILFFVYFVFITSDFIPIYAYKVFDSALDLKSASTGILAGLIIAAQRIIQISETSLGTSALSSSDRQNTPKQESLIQTMATLLSIGIAVIITTYIYAYGLETFDQVSLANNTFDQLIGFLFTVYNVSGYTGLFIIVCFFVLSGFTTILGSFHFLNSTLNLKVQQRIYIYLTLIFISGFLSILHFDLIFEITSLLMFIVGLINVFAVTIFVYKKKHRKQYETEI